MSDQSLGDRIVRARRAIGRGPARRVGQTALRALPALAVALSLLLPLAPPAPTASAVGPIVLSVSPASAAVTVNSNTVVNVTLNTNGQVINSAEIYLTFDPTLLDVVDADSGTSGVQVAYGDCSTGANPPLPTKFLSELRADATDTSLINTVHLAAGIVPPNPEIAVNCTLASVTFRGKAVGSSPLAFYVSGNEGTIVMSTTSASPQPLTVNDGTLTVNPIPPQTLAFSTQPGGGTTGVAWSRQPVVELRDQNGFRVTTDSSTQVSLAVTAGTGTGALSCTGGTTKTAVAGIATFSGCSINANGAGYTLTAAAANYADAVSEPMTIGPNLIRINPRPAGAPGGVLGSIKDVSSGIIRVVPAAASSATNIQLALEAVAPAAGLGAWGVSISYDSSIASIVSCTSTNGSVCSGNLSANPLTVQGAANPGLTGTPVLADIRIAVNSSASRGHRMPLGVTITNLVDGGTNSIAGGVRNTEILVGCASYDSGCDGTVNSTDSLCVLRAAAGGYPSTTGCPEYGEYNANRDANTNSTDSLCILRRAAGGYPPTAGCPALSMQFQPATGGAGTAVRVIADQFNFTTGTAVEIRDGSQTGTLLGSGTVQSGGLVDFTFTLPAGLSSGTHSFKAVVTSSGTTAVRDSANFVVP